MIFLKTYLKYYLKSDVSDVSGKKHPLSSVAWLKLLTDFYYVLNREKVSD